MKKSLIKMKSFFPQLRWTMYKVNKKKYLVLYRICFGRLLWSRHFLIDDIPDDRGKYSKCKDEERLKEFISSSNT